MTNFSCDALSEVWPSGQKPPALDRASRVALLGEFATATLAGPQPSTASLLFVAGAISAWLASGGDLARDYLKVTAPAGSHRTAAHVWQTLCEDSSSPGAQEREGFDSMEPSFFEGES